MYHADSFCDKGSLKHLQNIIRWSNLPPRKVKENVSAVQDFYSLVADAHIIAAAMTHFGMKAMDDEPVGIVAPVEKEELRDFMKQVGQLVDKYVMKFLRQTAFPMLMI